MKYIKLVNKGEDIAGIEDGMIEMLNIKIAIQVKSFQASKVIARKF